MLLADKLPGESTFFLHYLCNQFVVAAVFDLLLAPALALEACQALCGRCCAASTRWAALLQSGDELHLFVLTLNIHKEGESLPGIIEDIRERMEQAPLARQRLRRKLTLARYLDSDATKYDSRYKPRSEELFKVGEGFPRITKLDPGVGDLKYSIQISSCKDYEHGIDEFLGV